jgi:peptidylprolyl isomerase
MLRRILVAFALVIVCGFSLMTSRPAIAADVIVMQLKDGPVVIKPRPDLAPNHVARILELTRQGFYNGIVFHRVIDGFMAQTGDPTGTGMGGSGKKLKAEFTPTPHKRGIVSMARAADPNSADSQFFIVLDDASYLDGQYTVWGEVVSGMEHVDAIKKGSPYNNGSVTTPDKIITMTVVDEKDAPKP